MNIGEILIWESTNALLLIPVVIGLVMLVRWIRGWPVFTERDWLFLLGHPREKVLSLHLWLRFAVLWVAVVLIGFVEGYVLLPFGLAAFVGAVFLICTRLPIDRCAAVGSVDSRIACVGHNGAACRSKSQKNPKIV